MDVGNIAELNTYQPQPTCYRPDSLAPGASYPPIALSVAAADNSQPSVINAVSVTGGATASPAAGPDKTAVRAEPALAVTAFDSVQGDPDQPLVTGGVYSATVANEGYAATTSPVTFSMDLPAGLRPLSMSGTGWICKLQVTTCTTGRGMTLAAGAKTQITLQVAVSADAPLSAQTFMQATGGGEIPAAGLDLNNDDNAVSNGGEYVDPAYIEPAR